MAKIQIPTPMIDTTPVMAWSSEPREEIEYLLKVRSLSTEVVHTFTYKSLAEFDTARQRVKDSLYMELVQD